MSTNNKKKIIEIRDLKKIYRLGQYGYGTLTEDFKSWVAKIQGKEDPNSIIGSKEYSGSNGAFAALDGISLDVYEGDVIGIIGSNGAGKSTFLKLLSRITAPTAGMISYNGRISSLLEVGTGFSPEMTGRENIYLNGTILGMSKKEVDAKLDAIIAFSECAQFIDTPVKRYSSGMYVKLAFAVAAHLDSEILIMDEVLAVGDMKFQKKCIRKMKELATDQNRTVFYVSHNMDTIRGLCNRCVVLQKGKVVLDGDVEEAIGYYNDAYFNDTTFFDFKDDNRKIGNRRGRMRTVEFLHKNSLTFQTGEDMTLRFTWSAEPENQENYLIMLFYNKNNQLIGSSRCALGQTENNEINTSVMTFQNNTLVEGEYLVRFVLSGIMVSQDYDTIDWPESFLHLVIIPGENEELPWLRNEFGDVRLDDLVQLPK
ncbi:MAG: polysaccharide ABC transporter ATP-binding protein [Faecalibacterium sp.]